MTATCAASDRVTLVPRLKADATTMATYFHRALDAFNMLEGSDRTVDQLSKEELGIVRAAADELYAREHPLPRR